ncbi:MAG: Sec-independent protein translocase protein TatB [Gammaproteobacteria bacterium]|nr:Sec-independent protein translocase protein TatB [Gammaproteobacteria bacterium]
MFDIGFWELSLIGVVALLVIGPERLPSVARAAGLWVGRARRFVSTVKADIDQQLKTEELQRIVKQQVDNTGMHEIMEQAKTNAETFKRQAEELAEAGRETIAIPTDDHTTKPPQDDKNA